MNVIIEKTRQLNKIAGKTENAGWGEIISHFKLICSELAEVAAAIDARDIEKVRDGLGDILVLSGGASYTGGFDVVEDFKDIMISQLSRFDTNPEDAAISLKKYQDVGLPVYTRTSVVGGVKYYAVIVAEDCVHPITNERLPAGKYLKAHGVKLPSLLPLHARVVDKLKATEGIAAPSMLEAAVPYFTDRRND